MHEHTVGTEAYRHDVVIALRAVFDEQHRRTLRVELGSQSYEQLSMLDGKPVAGIRVFLQTGSNALETADRIRARLDALTKQFPPDVEYSIPFDTTRFVRSAIGEVRSTLIEAAFLVAIVVFLFLGSWRATIIPMIAVPVSLIGACAGLWVLGYGINILTLFAMVIAIGIVVDDAIVVLENTSRHIEAGMTRMQAALLGAKEVGFTVLSISLSLVAVFIPLLFMGGQTGRLFREFAVTLSAAAQSLTMAKRTGASKTLRSMNCGVTGVRQNWRVRPS